jgi:catechol 2,3-dioxygenase-like lactoylglutathione lyase family enzyme
MRGNATMGIIDEVNLPVADLERSRRFYETVLSASEVLTA